MNCQSHLCLSDGICLSLGYPWTTRINQKKIERRAKEPLEHTLLLRDRKRNFKRPFLQKCQCPIHNTTFKTFTWSIVWKILSFSKIVFNSDNSFICSWNRNLQFPLVEKPHLKFTSFQNYQHWYLIRQSL